MPAFNWSTAMVANQLGLNPLSGWQFETIPYAWPGGAIVQILTRSTTTGTRLTAYTGSATVQERSPIQGGGTAGVTPSELNTPALKFIAQAGDKIKLAIDEVAGGTPTNDGQIVVEPL